ncbi:helix-turn-helix domain-containing protein [Cellulophaga tyrosinoxydans]|uniref:Helix-turn-helix domain-containing protein n=1 Tax=Cellulophaga tyrosinoxydans TaxID=504486 RepID=A0A1W1Z2D3_9FLAO|nr:helix-turn-helix domain-containing protein [Cellulophaga tyrosinoxydans]SMC42615.1 Helix-turn-helix domain-containing protein [Cellulophaga tyrosinoxydans]
MEQGLHYNFLNTLMFSGIIFGITFSIVNLLNKNKNSKAKTLLIITVLSLTLSNLQYWLIDIGIRDKYQIPKVVYVQFELLILPFFYLFIRNYIQKKSNKKIIYLLLFPFVLGMTYQILAYIMYLERPLLKKYNLIAEILTLSFSIILIFLSFIEINKFEKLNNKLDYNKIGISTNWLKYSMISGIILIILWILTTQLFYNNNPSGIKIYYPLWIGISIVIYWIGIKGLIELRVYYERRVIRNTYHGVQEHKPTIDKKNSKGNILFQQLLNDFENQKIYLNPNLSLDVLAAKYNVSSGYLSQIINKYSDEGLADLVNNLRIKEAQNMLLDKSFENYTIESIALESGFNTKTNFYKVFKKLVGLTPNEYKKVQNL